jgi:hypothetical protein
MAIAFVANANSVKGGLTPAQSLSISYTPTVGHTLLIGVSMDSGSQVSSLFDDAGLDVFGNALNTWQNLGSVEQNGIRQELWGCCPISAAITQITAQLSNTVINIGIGLLDYSGVASFSSYGTQSNTGYNNLFFNGTPINNNSMLVAFFNARGLSPATGTGRIPPQNQPITAATERFTSPGISWGNGQFIALETSTISPYNELLNTEVISQNVTGGVIPVTGILAAGVVMNAGLFLDPTKGTAAGFADIDVKKITAGVSGSPSYANALHAMTLAQTASNAALGMVRPEFFYDVVVDGDTVPTPVSTVDGYAYQRDELMYIYTQITTFSANTGWTTAPGILFYCMWDVDPLSGKVTIKEVYHPDGNTPVNSTSDGELIVLTVAQRAQGGMTMKAPPNCYHIDTSLEAQDLPVMQSQLRAIVDTSKYAAVKMEVFYMGEFVDGQVAQAPSSPIDGYQYGYDEISFISSWLWTSSQGSFGPPPMATASGGNAHGGWSQMQRMEANISTTGLVHCQVFFYNNTEIDPTQPANGSQAFGRLRVYAFCQRKPGPSLNIPYLDSTTGFNASAITYITGIDGSKLDGTATGLLSVGVPGPDAAQTPFTITKIVIKKTAHGSNTVLTTTTLSSGATVNPQSFYTSPGVAYTFDQTHDYYIMIVTSGGIGRFTPFAGKLNSQSAVTGYNQQPGDQSAASSMSGLLSSDTNFRILQTISLRMNAESLAPGFAALPITALVPGAPLTFGSALKLAKNAITASRSVEVFGPATHVQGDTIPLPTSPIDGYTYSRSELMYIWQFRTTGQPAIRLWGWGCTISSAGVVNLMCWHVGDGGPVANIPSGAQIDVITIGIRSSLTQATTNNPGTNNGNPPTDLSSLSIGGQGGFTINGNS